MKSLVQVFFIFATMLSLPQLAKAEIVVKIGFLDIKTEAPVTLSNLDPIPGDQWLAGARVAISDNTTTGKFLGHNYELEVTPVAEGEDPLPALDALLAQDVHLIITNGPFEILPDLADRAKDALIFNTAAEAAPLREENCRSNLFHTIPSYQMRSDALFQFLMKKNWTDLAIIQGPNPNDRAFSEAVNRSATKFNQKIKSSKDWDFDADMRRNASAEVPLFTQELGEYDVLIIADESDDFARYVAYNTWEPRPVAGAEGIRPIGWHNSVEQWGAAQLQDRFLAQNGRPMNRFDYAAWAAIRAIGEAVTRINSSDTQALRDFMLSNEFELAGFLGSPLSFRNWNGQMRQPIPLIHERAMIAIAPIEGFLHQINPLDSLGIDAPESACKNFKKD